MKLLTILSAISLITLAGCVCPQPFTEISTGCFYFIISEPFTWFDARKQCQDIGTLTGETVDLAIFSNCHLYQEVVHHILKNSDTLAPPSPWSYWIGATDSGSEGDWRWNDNTPLLTGPPFWGSLDGQPMPLNDKSRNCANIYTDDQFYFHDGDCNKRAYPLCQILM